nr:integrase, catalytic region, zinc finger, CCHC-type, peptidase aspartic, catalytic [Tanacetum cinerariifolium]
MKSLKEKVKDRLVKQDQSLQTVHMLCRPRPLYNDLNKVAIGYKNPLCLTRAKQAQPVLYNGHEILKDNHARAKMHNSEDTLEIVEITRKKMNAKMIDPECVTHKAENDKVKKNYKQLYDSVKITHAKHIEQVTKLTAKNATLKTSVSKAKVQPPVLTRTKHAVDVEPIVPRLRNNREAHLDYLRYLKESVETIRDIVEEAKVVVEIVLWYLDSGCSKHITRDRSRLLNFVKKFIGTVRFGNGHFGAIMGYGDYVVGESVISRAEAMATACYTQNRSLIHSHHYKTPYELVHNKKPDLTFFRVFSALCYPTNDSEDLGKLQPTADTGIFVGYAPSRKGYRIYNKRTRRIMETIHVQFDELTEPMAPVHLSTGPAPTFLMPGQINSGLVPNPPPATPYAPPTNKELEILFQPMFDEYLDSAGTPLSTTIDQDAPSPYISPSSSALQSHSLPLGVVVEPPFIEDHNVAPVDNNPFVNVFSPEPQSDASSSGDISSTESPYISQTLHHLNKWSK